MLDLRERLVCREHDPDLWTEPEHEARAISLCLTCPIVTACLDFATDPARAELTGGGVWGGVNARRRPAMMKARAANLSVGHRYQTVTLPTPRTAPDLAASLS